MKIFIAFFLIFSTVSFAAKNKTRKISSSNYFVCNLDRDFADKKLFKKEYHFPFPMEKDEQYVLKGSMRWNKYSLIFSQDGTVEISITEQINGEKVTVEKTHTLNKEPYFDSFKVQLDLRKGAIVVPYLIQCGPE